MCLWRRSQVFVMNPARGEDWRWSSYRCYLFGEPGPVGLSKGWDEFRFDPARRENPIVRTDCYPPFAKRTRRMGHPLCGCASGRLGHPPASGIWTRYSVAVESLAVNRKTIADKDVAVLVARDEDHFFDRKALAASGRTVQKIAVALGNADGG